MICVVFMAKETLSSKKALEYLCGQCEIRVVCSVIRSNDLALRDICRNHGIQILTEEELKDLYSKGKLETDYILSFYWKKIKRDILAIPKKGSINFHPGPLPEARGSGYHMAILENWGYFGVTAHFMDEEFDTGEIIECRRFRIEEDILNADLVKMTHEYLYQLFADIIQQIVSGKELEKEGQEDGRYFSLSELEKNKLVQPDESIDEIDRKIRAFWNPPYSGAQIEIKGRRYTLVNECVLEWVAQHINKK